MERLCQSPEMADLISSVNLSADIVYFPIRHHSPACAWHVDKLIREWKPDAVLVEGPRDATELIPFLLDKETRLPVALFTTYIKREKDQQAEHYAAYYPFCDYSPEYAAIKAGTEINAKVKFIDLTFPEQIACRQWPDGKVQSLLDERYLRHSRFLQAACQRAGMRDSNDLWDHLYEDNFTNIPVENFIRDVLVYCALARTDYTEEMLLAEGSLIREQAMAAAIAAEKGRIIVVTGGFHTVSLPGTAPAIPKPVKTAAEDALTVLTRYSFDMLDSLNGYSSGMPSPEFYQRRWEGQDTTKLIIDIGRRIREQGGEISADDEINALTQAIRLSSLRGHDNISREDLLDGIRTSFVKGDIDVEGVLVLTHARNIMAGTRIGVVPKSAGLPPIVWDFRETATRFRLNLDGLEMRTVTLDLYRKGNHRLISRFMHQLRYLDVSFNTFQRGPNFVLGEHLDRIQEVWNYRWSPIVESSLVELSMYGSTLEQAAIALLWTKFNEAETAGQGGRASTATALIIEACRMGLHKQAQVLLEKTRELIGLDTKFSSLVSALNDILLLEKMREPLDGKLITGLPEIEKSLFRRASFLMEQAGHVPEEEEQEVLEALNSMDAARKTMDLTSDDTNLFQHGLQMMVDDNDGCNVLRGGAVGIMTGNGWISQEKVLQMIKGYLMNACDDGTTGIKFIQGLLACYRSILWQSQDIVGGITAMLEEWDEEKFLNNLPLLRLTFSSLTPRECDRTAQIVAKYLNIAELSLSNNQNINTDDIIYGAQINLLVAELLKKDGIDDILTKETVND